MEIWCKTLKHSNIGLSYCKYMVMMSWKEQPFLLVQEISKRKEDKRSMTCNVIALLSLLGPSNDGQSPLSCWETSQFTPEHSILQCFVRVSRSCLRRHLSCCVCVRVISSDGKWFLISRTQVEKNWKACPLMNFTFFDLTICIVVRVIN